MSWTPPLIFSEINKALWGEIEEIATNRKIKWLIVYYVINFKDVLNQYLLF
jgi:hypothetical protein